MLLPDSDDDDDDDDDEWADIITIGLLLLFCYFIILYINYYACVLSRFLLLKLNGRGRGLIGGGVAFEWGQAGGVYGTTSPSVCIS
jgi:hypothetical protein